MARATNDARRGRNGGSKRVIASVAVATVLACAGAMPIGAEAKAFGRKATRSPTRGRVSWRRFATKQVTRTPYAANVAHMGQATMDGGESCIATCAALTSLARPDHSAPCDQQPGCVYNHGDNTCISMISESKDDPQLCPPERIDGGMKGNVCNGKGLPTCFSIYSAEHPDAFDDSGHYLYPEFGDEEYNSGDANGTGPTPTTTSALSSLGDDDSTATSEDGKDGTEQPKTTTTAYPATTEQPKTTTTASSATTEQPKTTTTTAYPAATEQPKTTTTGAFTTSAGPTTPAPAHHGHHGHHKHRWIPKWRRHHAHHTTPQGPSGVEQLEGGPTDPPPEDPPVWPQEGPSCVETCSALTEKSGPDNTQPCDSQPGCVFNHGDATCISMVSQSKDDPTTCPPNRMDDGMKGNQCNGDNLPTCYELYSTEHPDAFDENGHYTYPFYGDDEYDEHYDMTDNDPKTSSLGRVHRNVRILAEQNDVYYGAQSSLSKLTVALGAAFAFASGFVARGVSRRRQVSDLGEAHALGQSAQTGYGAAV